MCYIKSSHPASAVTLPRWDHWYVYVCNIVLPWVQDVSMLRLYEKQPVNNVLKVSDNYCVYKVTSAKSAFYFIDSSTTLLLPAAVTSCQSNRTETDQISESGDMYMMWEWWLLHQDYYTHDITVAIVVFALFLKSGWRNECQQLWKYCLVLGGQSCSVIYYQYSLCWYPWLLRSSWQ